MARQVINIGTTANDGTGDPLRTAFDKINDNFVELYGADNNLNTLDANLDVNNYVITTGITNGNITITPNGTGNINLGSITINGSTISSNDSTQITVAENIQTTGTLNVDGTTTIGGATTLNTSLTLASGATVSEFSTDGTMAGNSNTAVPTENAVKTYVDAQVTAQDLDFTADDSTTNSIDLGSEVLEFKGGTGITTSAFNNQVNINIDSTVATLTGSQTLTNKTLTSPTINGATMTGSVSIDNITINDTDITTSSNANLTLNPGGTGTIQLSANTAITGTASVSGTLTTADVTTVGNQTISGNLSTGGDLTVNGSIIADTLTFASNGDITIDPAGTGAIILTGDVTHTGTHTTTGDLQVDNININSNTISSTNTNGGINILPNGTGVITLGGNYVAVTNELAANDVAVGSELLMGSGAEIVAVTTNDDLTLRTNGTGSVIINTGDVLPSSDNIQSLGSSSYKWKDVHIGPGSLIAYTPAGVAITLGYLALSKLYDYAQSTAQTSTLNLAKAIEDAGFTADNATAVKNQQDSGFTVQTDGSTPNFVISNSLTNGNVDIVPNGTGKVNIDNIEISDNEITTNTTDANLTLTPNGTGSVVADTVTIKDRVISTNESNADITITPTGSGSVIADTIKFKSNEILPTASNTNLTLSGTGTGKIISSTPHQFNAGYIEPINALTSSSTITVNCGLASVHTVTLAENTQFVISNLPVGGTVTLIITQDGGGSNTGTFGTDGSTAVKFAGGTPTLSTAGGAIDVVTVFNDGVNYLGNIAKAYA